MTSEDRTCSFSDQEETAEKNECGMPIRFRRKRTLATLIASIVVVVYLITSGSHSSTSDPIDSPANGIDSDDRRRTERARHASTTAFRPAREEVVDIGGKKWKKIDWHDYDFIAREDSRTGLPRINVSKLVTLLFR